MLPVGNVLVSDDVRDVKFVCDIARCHGGCCVAGDAGAPLEPEEIEQIMENLDAVIPYMTTNGINVVKEGGAFDYDMYGKFVTPLVDGRECAFVYFTGRIARCAIEKAFEKGESTFRKPLSCHLYPIRITRSENFEAANYHQWSVCVKALVRGAKENVPLYVFLKEPLIRCYGQQWYEELLQAIDVTKNPSH